MYLSVAKILSRFNFKSLRRLDIKNSDVQAVLPGLEWEEIKCNTLLFSICNTIEAQNKMKFLIPVALN